MACIIYREDKKTGTKYAYRSESYRDPQTKKPKSKRTYLYTYESELGKQIAVSIDGNKQHG